MTKLQNKQKNDPQTIAKRRGACLCFAAAGGVLLLFFLGEILAVNFGILKSSAGTGAAVILSLCSVLIPLLWIGISLLLTRRFQKKFEHIRVAEVMQTYLRERAAADVAAERLLVNLRRIRIITALLGGLFLLFAAVGAFLYGVLTGNGVIGTGNFYLLFFFWNVALIGAARIRLPLPCPPAEAAQGFLEEQEFPTLYSVARRAADAEGCRKKIRLRLSLDCGVAIAEYPDTVDLAIGVGIASILSEEELYAIFLHEFEHPAQSNAENRFYEWLTAGQVDHVFSKIYYAAFRYPISRYLYLYSLYSYASSLGIEAAADRAMVKNGDRKVAASALLKVYFGGRAEWEGGAFDWKPTFAPEEMPDDFVHQYVARFRDAVARRSALWLSQMPREILSHQATHPTMKSRLDAIGVTEYTLLPADSSPAFEEEREKMICRMETVMADLNRESYAEQRKEKYLRPMETIEGFRAEGERLTAEGYGDVLEALFAVGRVEEALALCDRAIAELPEQAALQAMMTKGCILLCRTDPEGVPLVRHAMENNTNFIDDGIEALGRYFCTVGDEEGLAEYRAFAAELRQKQIDAYGELGVLKKGDRLTAEEELPQDEREANLSAILAAGGDRIGQVYLVRKVITEELFTDAYILRVGADRRRRGKRSSIRSSAISTRQATGNTRCSTTIS